MRIGTLRQPNISEYLVLTAVLAAAVVGLAVALKLNRYFLLLLAGMFYPYAMQLAFSGTFRQSSTDLLRNPTPGHLALLFVPPLLLACGIILTAVRPRRSRVMSSRRAA